jgi:anti-sigma factor ChrR (cupin superfamily)
MPHETVVAALPELIEGRLDPASAAEIEAHLAGCDECRQYRNACRLVALAARLDPAVSETEHPDADEIVAFATTSPTLDGARRQAIEVHVAACAGCAQDVRATHAARSAARRAARAPAVRADRLIRVVALAASVLVAVLAWPAWLGVGDLGGASRAPAGAPWSGAATLTVLASDLRGTGGEIVVRLARTQPHVLLGVDLAAGATAGGAARNEVAIVGADGVTRFSRTFSATEAQSLAGASGVVVLVVPAADLAPGSYLLSVSRDGRRAFESRFRTVSGD